MSEPEPGKKPAQKMPTGLKRARLARRARLVFGVGALCAMLWRMIQQYL